jgi:hypothetical protein
MRGLYVDGSPTVTLLFSGAFAKLLSAGGQTLRSPFPFDRLVLVINPIGNSSKMRRRIQL